MQRSFLLVFMLYVCVYVYIYVCIYTYMCSTAVVRDECVLGIDTRREEGTTPW